MEFCKEFEEIYVQRRPERIDFVRQSIHSIWHMPSETKRTGPAAYTSQWPLERTIGDLGQQIRQPSNPFANLSQRCVIQAQINVLKSVVPGLDRSASDRSAIPHNAIDLHDQYVLLHPTDNIPRPIELAEVQAVHAYIAQRSEAAIPSITKVTRWARLRLPNRQIARSHWKESLRPEDKLRTSRYVQVTLLFISTARKLT